MEGSKLRRTIDFEYNDHIRKEHFNFYGPKRSTNIRYFHKTLISNPHGITRDLYASGIRVAIIYRTIKKRQADKSTCLRFPRCSGSPITRYDFSATHVRDDDVVVEEEKNERKKKNEREQDEETGPE
ncbi:hypothetical protein GWI33_021684, partial [Rhynchophorus ferrugineus]